MESVISVIVGLSISVFLLTVTALIIASWIIKNKRNKKEKLIAQSNCVIEKQETTSVEQRPEDPVPVKRKRININHEIDSSLWIEKIEAMLDDKERNLKSDNKVFADHKIDRMRFKRLATKEQKERHVKLQELCKANGRKIFAQHVSKGAKGTR